MKSCRIYLVMSKKLMQAYIGKGPDGRLEGEHSPGFLRLLSAPDVIQYESRPFSSPQDALIAEAAAIGIVKSIAGDMNLINIQKNFSRRFFPRYPIPFKKGRVSIKDLAQAIVVTLSPDKLEGDRRVAPNSPWKPEELAERARKYWLFARWRVEQWSQGEGAPKLLVAVAKGNGRILGSLSINNGRWRPNKDNKFAAVPLKDITNANFWKLQGKLYTGNRQGGAVTYGANVS